MLSSNAQCGPTNDFPFFDARMHCLSLLQGADVGNEREDFPTCDQVACLEDVSTGDVAASKEILFLVEHVHRGRLEQLAGTSESDQAAVTSKRFGAGFQCRGVRDVIYDHIDPLSARQIEQRFDEFATRIDHRVGASLAASLEFVRGNLHRNHPGSCPFRHHQLMNPESAASTDHRDRFTRLDARAAQYLVGRRQRIGDDPDFRWMTFVIQSFG
jgi:hypothetical protein